MLKKLTSLVCCFIGVSALSQNSPVIDNIYLSDTDPICFGGDTKQLAVVVTDNDGDACGVSLSFANGYLDYFAGTPDVSGNTTTHYFNVFVSWSTPPPAGTLTTDDINIFVDSYNGADPSQTATGSLTAVPVNGQIEVTFNVPSLTLCNFGNPVNLYDYVDQPGGTFSYLTGNPYYQSTSGALIIPDASAYYYENDYSMYVDYLLEDGTGCVGNNTLSIYFVENPSVTMNEYQSTCTNADGSVDAFITGGAAPYDVYWSTGKTELGVTTTMIDNLSSGVYYLNVEDQNGCKAVKKAHISDSDIAVSYNSVERKCIGQNGMVTLTITPTTGSVSEIIWSNGQTSATLSSGPGEYSVAVHTTANCNFFGTYEILDSALKVKVEGAYDNSDCISAPSGGIDITTTGGTGVGTYNWNWTKNGVPGFASTEDIWTLTGGVYSCTVQDGAGCTVTWGKTISNPTNVYLYVNETTKPTCGNTDGAVDIFVDPFWDTPAFYEWNTGATTEDLSGISAGNYTLTYTDQAGCTGYLTVKLQNEKPYQPSICLLTVDTSLTYNTVVWEKDITQNISGFNIYRETSDYGIFEKVVSRDSSLESFFQDNDASPMDRSWRYYMTSYDACGGESYPSFVHKTIHVVANTSNGIDYDLSWDDYEGINYTSIDVLRYDPTNGWVVIGDDITVGNTFPDTPPVVTGLDYMVTFNLADPCTSSKVQDHNSSRSNKTASAFDPGGSTVQVQDEELGLISLYPNPTNSQLTIHVDNPELFTNYVIRDINGQIVAEGTILYNNTILDLEYLAGGMYTVQLFSEQKVVVEKIMKQ
ncbi:MAG: T9SS type A sorting domain-containing protein [Crocinitomicaceae bacterium]|nr:T9SS type A sorting domain-containing protein [Crocinitomicaceae bacterium]